MLNALMPEVRHDNKKGRAMGGNRHRELLDIMLEMGMR